MNQNRIQQQSIELTLGPGGFVLTAHPALRSMLQLSENDKISFAAVYASVQPKNVFLSLINNEGTGVFTLAGKLFEIISKKSSQGNETILTFQQIGDDNPQLLPSAEAKTPENPQKNLIKPFDLIKIFDLVFNKVKPAQTCAYYLLEPNSKALFPQFARGFQDDARIKRIVLPENQKFLQAIQNKQPLHLGQLNFFEDYNLDPASIFEYRYATGGRIPLSAIFLPLNTDATISSALIVENYDSAQAFSDVKLADLLIEIENISLADDKAGQSTQNDIEIHLQAIDTIYTSIDLIDPNKDLIENIKKQLSFLIPFDQSEYYRVGPTASLPITESQATSLFYPALASFFKPCVTVRLDQENTIMLGRFALQGYASHFLLPIFRSGSLDGVISLSKKTKDGFTQSDQNTASLFLKFLNKKLSVLEVIHPKFDGPAQTEVFQQNEKRLSQNTAVWEAIFDGILVTDSINRIQFTNNALSKYLNMPLSQMGEPNIDTVNTFFKTTLSNWKEKILHWSINPDSINTNESYSEQVRLQNGRVLSIHLTPVVWKKEFLGTVSIFRDVSYEFEFDRLKTDFITSISHELRTPLTSIQGYVDLLLMGVAGNLSDEQRGFMGIVKNNSERLNNLINDMLELTTIEAGKVNLSIHPTDIFELAQEVLNRYKARCEKENKSIEFYLETDSSIPLVLADSERAKQILENLVNNAYSFSESDGKITISLQKNNESLQVNVSDTGIGISKEQKEQIFDHFSRGDNPSPQMLQGVGLGLPIVKQLVELQNGKIWVESSGVPGEGSTFSFTLPAQVET